MNQSGGRRKYTVLEVVKTSLTLWKPFVIIIRMICKMFVGISINWIRLQLNSTENSCALNCQI